MDFEIVRGIARHLLGAAGAALASYGYIEATQVEAFVGASFVLVSMGLSILDKKKRS